MTAVTATDAALLERDSELDLLRGAVAAAGAGRGAVVVIEAAPGMGKTSLLDAAVHVARDAGFAVATARAGEVERDFVWGVVRQMLEPAARDDTAGLLSGAAALAGPVFEGDDRATGGFAALHGLFWLVHGLATRTPLILAVDDAQWADAASLRWLAYMAPRTRDLPLVLVMASRPRPPDDVVRIAAQPGALCLAPQPLTGDAVGALVRSRLNDAADPAFVEACREATGGNPFLVRELVGALAADATAPSAANAEKVRELRPDTISRSVLMRLSALSPNARELARAVAVLDRRAKARHAAALAGLDGAAAEAAMHELVDADVLADASPLTFVHPLVRAVVHDDLSVMQIGRLNARAAAALEAEDAPPEAIAPHLLRVEPSNEAGIRATLVDAAADARRRGAPAIAADFLRRALAEAPPADERATLNHALALSLFDACGAPAIDEFRTALDAAPDDRTFAVVSLDLGRALHVLGDHPEAARVYDRGFARLGETTSDLARALEAQAIITALQDRSTAPIAAERLPAAAGRLGAGGVPDAMVTAALALVTAAAGGPGGATLAEQAIASSTLGGAEQLQALALACFALAWSDRLDDVSRVWEERVEEFRRDAALPALSFACCFAAHAALLRGDPARAESFARESLAVAPGEWALTPPDPACFLAEALMERGDVAGAQQVLDELDYDPALPERQGYSTLLMTRARLHLAGRRPKAAIADLLELGRRLERWGVLNPAAYPWRSTAAVALARSDPGRATDLADAELDRARAFGAPRALGIALRGRGLIAGEAGVDLLRESVAVLEPSAARLEHARSVAALGSALRRAGWRREAVPVLREALATATAQGGRALADHVRGELHAAGARPRRDALRGRDALTASERRVAELASRGMTNRQIAETLFVTLRTVETHLTHAYRKLDVTSRSELAQISW